MLAPQIWIVFHSPCTWNYYPSHLSSCRDDLRLSCLLAQALMPLESIAICYIEWCYIVIWLNYVFSYLWVVNHIFNKFKELDLSWYCQMSIQVLSFTWFFTQISNKFSQHWRAAWNQSEGRMRAVGCTALVYGISELRLEFSYVSLSDLVSV